MISREDMLKVERGVIYLIGLCQGVREGETEDNAAYKLLVNIEAKAHEMTKDISNITENELKQVHHVDFRGGTS